MPNHALKNNGFERALQIYQKNNTVIKCTITVFVLLCVYVVYTTVEGFRAYRICRNEHKQNTHKHKQSSRKSGTVNIASGHSACTVSFKLPIASGI